MKKICFKCKIEKGVSDFYKHKAMKDGHLNKCIECTKKDVEKRYFSKIEDPDFVEKERERGREKYKRLNYKENQKIQKAKFPWKNEGVLKNLNKKLKVEKGFECHHWSYNDNHLTDVFILNRRDHKKVHKYLVLDIEKRMFKTIEGMLLNTKELHEEYISKILNIPF
jgi:hypothetical protein